MTEKKMKWRFVIETRGGWHQVIDVPVTRANEILNPSLEARAAAAGIGNDDVKRITAELLNND